MTTPLKWGALSEAAERVFVCPRPLARNGALQSYGYYTTEH